jgi:ABC-type transport system involved in cytochrome c biogenesis permease subunit
MIHVAVIVGSYGPLALGMILGAVALLLILFTNEKQSQMDLNIQETTYQRIINDRFDHADYWSKETMCCGQGRYWGWDQRIWSFNYKLYAFVIHARLFLLYVENVI